LGRFSQTDRLVVSIAFFSFVVLGLPGGLLNIAWSPSMRDTFRLPLDAVGLLLLATTGGYFVASAATGRLMAHFGVARLLASSTTLSALGLLGMAVAPTWVTVLLCGLLVGTGAGSLDGGMNIYFAEQYGPQLMNWLHACFGIGATLGPLTMTALLNSGCSWRPGYCLAALLYGISAVLFVLTRTRWSVRTDAVASRQAVVAPVRETLKLPVVWLGIGLFLAYTSLEMSAGQWSFPLFTESRHVAKEVAGLWVGLYWGSFTAGRIFFGAILTWVQPMVLLRRCMLGAVLGAALLAWKPLAGAGCLALALIGFSLSPIFALMITDTRERLGPVHAPNAIGFQVAAAAAGAGLLPGVAGVLAKHLGLEVIPPFLLAMTATMFILFELDRALPTIP
jgi:fucose permease